MPDDPPEHFGARLRRLRDEAGLSRSQLSRKTAAMAEPGLPEITIKVLETDHRRQPEINTIEILAQALGVAPETFHEYRLAVARRTLDEREVGLAEALSMLEAIEEALLYPRAAEALERLAAEQNGANDQTPPASEHEPPNRAAG